MIIYHGSTFPIQSPAILQSERKLDFGEGFYTTFNREQAIRWLNVCVHGGERVLGLYLNMNLI